MQAAERRRDEAAALVALDDLRVMDSAPDPEFEALVQAASLLCEVPIALINLIDADRQWFKANIGLPGLAQTPRDQAFCAHAVLGDDVLVVPDATQDERFADNPLVTGAPGIRFYAGAPLRLSSGHQVGTLCLIDRAPRQLSAVQRQALQCLAVAAASALEGRRARLLAEQAARDSVRAALVQQHSADAIIGLAADLTIVRWNPAAERLFGHAAQEIVGQSVERLVRPEHRPAERDAWARLADGIAQSYDATRRHRDGSDVAVAITLVPERDAQGVVVGATLFARDNRPHLRALEDAAAREQHVRRLYEATPAMLHAIDPEGRLTMVSDAWLARLGYARDEVLGRRSIDFLTPASREHALQTGLPTLMREGRYDELEQQMITRSGEVIDVLLSAIVDRDPAGAPLSMVAGLQDVTLRRRAERALEAERQRLVNIIEGTHAGIWEWHVPSGALRLNDRSAAMLGSTLVELGETTIALREGRTHPDDVAAMSVAMQQHLSGLSGYYEVESRVRHRDGHWVWILDRGRLLTRTPQGTPEWVFGIHQDITARKQQEQALRKSEDFLARTGRLAGVGGWELDVASGAITWSDETRRMHGVAADYQPDLASAIQFYAPEARAVIQQAVAAGLSAGTPWDLELPLIRADGRRIWARAVGSVDCVEGKPLRLAGAFQDITERKLLEQKLTERSAALTRSNEDLERFAYVASHDLQEPLRMVTSYGQLLARRHSAELSAQAQEFLHHMVDGGQRAQTLIRDLLSLARLDSQGAREAVSLQQVLADTLQAQRLKLSETGAVLTHDPLPTVVADPVQMRQLLANLVGNALKFVGPRPPVLHIGVERVGTAWRISVRDNGIGIDPKYFERVFVMFQRLHLRSEHEGTGIGLALCKKIVERHGGQIGVESVPGEGTTFHFTLPDAPAEPAPRAPE